MNHFDPDSVVDAEVEHVLAGDIGKRFSTSTDPRAAATLAHRMSEISEWCYCAGWLIDCEHVLWRMLADPNMSHEWGMGTVDPHELSVLKELSDKCGGWIVWRSHGHGETWISLDEWLPIHAKWEAKLAERMRAVPLLAESGSTR